MMSYLTELAAFVSIVKNKGFRAASVELGVSPSAASLTLKKLENRLQLKLINRSTRSMSLTEAGQRLYNDLSVAFTNVDRALDNLSEFRDKPTGTVRIVASRLATRLHLVRLADLFVQKYPSMAIEICADDALSTLSDENFDAGVRLGAIVPEHMIALPIGPKLRFSVVATAGYWSQFPSLEHPHSLRDHNCIGFRFPSSKRSYQWEFRRENEEISLETKGNIIVNDMDFALDLALRGAGVSYLLFDQVLPYINSGELVPVLEKWLPERFGFHMYYPAGRLMTRGFEAFKELVKQDNMTSPASLI